MAGDKGAKFLELLDATTQGRDFQPTRVCRGLMHCQLCGSMANEEVLKHWTNQAISFDATEDLEQEQAEVELHPFKFVDRYRVVLVACTYSWARYTPMTLSILLSPNTVRVTKHSDHYSAVNFRGSPEFWIFGHFY